jgi:hypothetical protein
MLKFVPHMGNPIVFVAQNATALTAVESSLLWRPAQYCLACQPTARRRQDDRKRSRSRNKASAEAHSGLRGWFRA